MRLLCPDDLLDGIQQITPEFLAARGLRGLLVDLDNTLVPYGSYGDHPEMTHWLKETAGAGIQLYLLSNATKKRASIWLSRLQIDGIGMAGKPNPNAFKQAAAQLKLLPYQVGMVGDQVFTDVLGGNLAGLHTILVRPLNDNALPHTQVARHLERVVLKRFGYQW